MIPAPLAIAPSASSMGEASRAAALVAASRRAQAMRASPERCTPYRSSVVPGRSHCTPALRSGSVHRRTVVRSTTAASLRQQASALPLEPRERAAPRTNSVDVIARRCNTLYALVANTVGRGGRNNFPVIAVAAPALQHGAVLQRLRLRAQSRRHPRGGWGRGWGGTPGGTPSQGLRPSRQPAAAICACLNPSRAGFEFRTPPTPATRHQHLNLRPEPAT
jgi:hypothetical protein